jgi:hypothetical protein
MGSKLEYWFLLTKIAIVVLDVMILKMASALSSQRLLTRGGSCGMLVVGSFFNLPSQIRQFSHSSISNRVWILDFPIHRQSQLPKIRPTANFLSTKLLRWKLENPKISELPKILPILPKISQFPIQSPKSNFQSPNIIQPERYYHSPCSNLA